MQVDDGAFCVKLVRRTLFRCGLSSGYIACQPSIPVNMPAAINKPPTMRAVIRPPRGFSSNQARVRLDRMAMKPYTPAWVSAVMIHNTSACPQIGPASIFRNCGNIASMKTYAFGLSKLVSMLSLLLARPVNDATGLEGGYDFQLYWSPDASTDNAAPRLAQDGTPIPATPDADSGLTLFAAVQQQLGLKLDSQKGQVDVLVVDHAEKVPTGN